MKKASFELVPTPEFKSEIERIARQYEGLKRLSITAHPSETLVIQAKYYHKGKPVSIWVDVRKGSSIEDKAATLQTLFYKELVHHFETDLIPAENF